MIGLVECGSTLLSAVSSRHSRLRGNDDDQGGNNNKSRGANGHSPRRIFQRHDRAERKWGPASLPTPTLATAAPPRSGCLFRAGPKTALAREQVSMGAFRIPRRVPERPSADQRKPKTSPGRRPALPVASRCLRHVLASGCLRAEAHRAAIRRGTVRPAGQPSVSPVRLASISTPGWAGEGLAVSHPACPGEGIGTAPGCLSNLPRSASPQEARVHELAVRTSLVPVLRLLRSVMPHSVRRA